MGIVHFVPVGKSPGAATSALSYLAHNAETLKGDYKGGIIESVVLFCSQDVREGTQPADDYIWNDYGRRNHRHGWQRPSSKQNVIEVVRDFLITDKYLDGKVEFYVCPVDVNDYRSCFTAAAQATLAKARGDATGKYVWAGLTGGTNVLNAAIMQVASLSGLIGRMYYTFVARESDRCYLNPFAQQGHEFRYVEIPLVKTMYDYGYYRVLELLQDGKRQMGTDILSQLKQDPVSKNIFGAMSFEHFKRQYLNRMAGDVLAEEKKKNGKLDRSVWINDRGRALLEYLHLDELIEALVHRDTANPDLGQRCRELLAECRC